MIAAAPEIGYIHEPFSIELQIEVIPGAFPNYYQYITEENEGGGRKVLQDIIRFRYPFWHNLGRVRTHRDLAKLWRDQLLSWRNSLLEKRPLLKDPIALFSAGWIHRCFDADVLVLIRHPAAFVSSLKIVNWTFDFQHFLRQPLLMEKLLHPFADEIRECATAGSDIIEQGILLWNCIHFVISEYKRHYPNWIFIRHEDLSADPIAGFQKIFDRLGVTFSNRVKNRIEKTSGTHNPVEQIQGKEFRRNSRANIKNWKNRLSKKEIETIRKKTNPVAGLFYSDKDW